MNKEEKDIKCCVTQCENPLDQNYWETQWQSKKTGWDIGQASPAITEYFKQYPNKNAAILIPGCGNAYEAEYLVANGFKNITLIDISPKAVETLKAKFADMLEVKIFCEDFFQHKGSYDLIVEQTFFCAIPPFRRNEYAEKTASLLNENGKLIGVLFDKQFNQPFPPFGGCPCEYKPIFEPYFTIKKMEECYNSIPPRHKSEVFINLIKKKQ
jgi:SAM-dependent methyltransferase